MAASFPDRATTYRGGILRIGLLQRFFLDPILQRRVIKTGYPATRNPGPQEAPLDQVMIQVTPMRDGPVQESLASGYPLL